MSHSKVRTAIGHAFFLLAAAQGLHAASFGYIAESMANSVSVIETANNYVVARIPVGRYPDGVAVNAAGTAEVQKTKKPNSCENKSLTPVRLKPSFTLGKIYG